MCSVFLNCCLSRVSGLYRLFTIILPCILHSIIDPLSYHVLCIIVLYTIIIALIIIILLLTDLEWAHAAVSGHVPCGRLLLIFGICTRRPLHYCGYKRGGGAGKLFLVYALCVFALFESSV